MDSDYVPSPLDNRISNILRANQVNQPKVSDDAEQRALLDIIEHVSIRMPYDILLEKKNYSKVQTYGHWKGNSECNTF